MNTTSLQSWFMQSSNQIHFGAAKNFLRRGTTDYGTLYHPSAMAKLIGYTNSDWAGSGDDKKSIADYAFTLGSGILSWISQKQDSVVQSIAEAGYVVATMTNDQALWLRKILKDIGEAQPKLTPILYDNKSAIAVLKNLIFHGKTKDSRIKYHFIREV